MTKEFLVKGSSGETYRVRFQLDRGELSAYCSCPAGENGRHCKHRINILRGSDKGVVSNNASEVAEVAAWMIGTDLETRLNLLEQLESDETRIKSELSKAKRNLSKTTKGQPSSSAELVENLMSEAERVKSELTDARHFLAKAMHEWPMFGTGPE